MEVTKTCSQCNKTKSVDNFHKNKSRSDGRQGVCKECRVTYVKQHYETNRVAYIARSKVCNDKHKRWFEELKNKPCIDCQRSFHFSQMDFDHLENKEMNLSDMIRRGFGKKKILKEVEKCELVCANCHRLRTYNRSIQSRIE